MQLDRLRVGVIALTAYPTARLFIKIDVRCIPIEQKHKIKIKQQSIGARIGRDEKINVLQFS